MLSLAGCSVGAWVYVIQQGDPSLVLHRLAFFVTFFLATMMVVASINYYLSCKLAPDLYSQPPPTLSLRRGVVGGTLLSLLAWLQLVRALNVVNLGLLVAVAIGLEVYLTLRR